MAFISLLFQNQESFGQCEIKAFASSSIICTGDTIDLWAVGNCGNKLSNNFNSGNLGLDLFATASPTFLNPCGFSLDSSTYLWMGSGTSGQRSVTTASLDLSSGSCQICFDMRYAIHGQVSPCEGPDAINEGVTLQYSINGGLTWIDIQYWNPNGGNDPTLTKWNNYCIPLPLAAKTSNTKLRWIQKANMTSNQGHWGLDNIKINCTTSTFVVWAHGPTGNNPPPVSPGNTGYYKVTIFDISNGLSAKDSILITVNPKPNASFIATTPICLNDTCTVKYLGIGLPTAIYNWDFSGANIISGSGQGPYQINWNKNGIYPVTLDVNQNGCKSEKGNQEVLVAPLISFYIDQTKGCEPFTIKLKDNSLPAGSIYLWNFGDGGFSNLAEPEYTYTKPGNFDLTLSITTFSGCSSSFHIPNLIHVYPKPYANFNAIPEIAPLSNPLILFKDISSSPNGWEWDFGDPLSGSSNNSSLNNPSHLYSEKGSYLVTLITSNQYHCKDTIIKTVKILDDKVELPNVITPNNDGFNDYFKITNSECILESNLQIFNRWGNIVYSAMNYQSNWNGEGLSDGVYFFILQYKTYFSEEVRRGSITIIR